MSINVAIRDEARWPAAIPFGSASIRVMKKQPAMQKHHGVCSTPNLIDESFDLCAGEDQRGAAPVIGEPIHPLPCVAVRWVKPHATKPRLHQSVFLDRVAIVRALPRLRIANTHHGS